MGKCRWCGARIRTNRVYCSRECMYQSHAMKAGGGRSVIGRPCRNGAKLLCVEVIKYALRDGDFRWIYSRESDLFFELADLKKWRVMEGYDDDLNPVNGGWGRSKGRLAIPPEFAGMTKKEIAEMHGICVKTLHARLKNGMSWSEALGKPVKR